MARFITVNVQCDRDGCGVVAPEGEGIVVEKTLSVDGKQGRAFLLCKQHLDEFEEFVLPLMQAGVKVENGNTGGRSKGSKSSRTSTGTSSVSASSAAEDDDGGAHPSLVCKVPDCDRDGRPLTNRTGMAQHVIRSHGYTDLAAYELQYGKVASVPRGPNKKKTVEPDPEPDPS